MRTPISRIERLAGLFVGAAMLLLLAVVVATGWRIDVLDLFREGYVIYAVADQAHGAVDGSPVKLLGVEMGSVTAVELRDDARYPVRITIRLKPSAEGLVREGMTAVIVEPPLGSGMPPFGTATIELRQGDKGGPLPKRATLVATGEPSLVQTVMQLGTDISTLREQLVGTIKEMGTTFSNLRQLTEMLTSGEGMAGKMLRDPKLADQMDATLVDARAAVGDLRRTLGQMGQVTTQLSPVIADAQQLSRDGQRTMARVDVALDALPRLVASTERTLAATEELVASLRRTAGYAPELARKVDLSLEETGRLVEAAQRTIVLRSNLPDRAVVRTEATVRPSLAPPAPSSSVARP